jgi:iron-sulfur cluster assembly accessory protein
MIWNFSPTDERPILFTPAAVQAALAELEEFGDEGDFVRVTISPEGTLSPQYSLDFENKLRPGDVVMDFGGLTVVVGTESAHRLRGTVVNYVELPTGTGYKFHKPTATE